MSTTLAYNLKAESINFETLHKRYHPMLALVNELIGVIPNCDPILEIWPTGFRTYNLLVPNMFNLPNTLFGSRSYKSLMGLAMYASSNTAECAYCTAHTCSYALRRGAKPESINGARTEKEKAIVRIAEGLSRIPVDLTLADINNAKTYLNDNKLNGIAHAIIMMGFLNKFMDAVGVELEQNSINDVGEILKTTNWNPDKHIQGTYKISNHSPIQQDNIFTYLRVLRQAPGAIRIENKWTSGVPSDYLNASNYLKELTGYTFPILQPIKECRVIRALTTVLRDNLNSDFSIVGLKAKILSGYVFARVVSNQYLAMEIKEAGKYLAPEISDQSYLYLEEYAKIDTPNSLQKYNEVFNDIKSNMNISDIDAAALLLTIGASPSPAIVNDVLIDQSFIHLNPKMIVELNVWISIQQLLHRLSSYYNIKGAY